MDRIRGLISVIVVSVFMVVLALLALLPLLAGVDNAASLQTIKDFSAALSGVVGVIVGFYFGRHDAKG